MSVKLPPKEVRNELKKRNYKVREWSKRGESWYGYDVNAERFVTVATVTGKAVVEVLQRDVQFEVLL